MNDGTARFPAPLVQETVARRDRLSAGLYERSGFEQPLRAAMFTVEQLEVHARAMAATHVLDRRRGDDRLLSRLSDSGEVIAAAYDRIAEADAANRRLAPAAEWLLDNHYLVEEQIRLARRHLPRGYSRQLPRLKAGDMAGYPRIYDLILQFIAHVDGRVDAETLSRFVTAYQSVSSLRLGELWAVPIMLRLALIENLRRVTAGVIWRRSHRDRATAWAGRLNAAASRPDGDVVLAMAELIRENPPLSAAFVSDFTQTLQGQGSASAFIITWLEQRLGQHGQTIDDLVRAEGQGQAADQVSMANSIASLRFVNAADWHDFVEAHSGVERILRTDPAGVHAKMDFATRDSYRHVVERISRRVGVSEELVAQIAVDLAAGAADSADPLDRDVVGHIGYYLTDGGYRQLYRAIRGQTGPSGSATLEGRRRGRKRRLALYLAGIMIVTVAAVGTLAFVAGWAAGPIGPALWLCAVLAGSQFAVAMVNWLASLMSKPKALPRMDFERNIPDTHRTMVAVPVMLTGKRQIEEMVENLERRSLANRAENLWFALLSDWVDAPTEQTDTDQRLLDLAARRIEELNERYAPATGEAGPAFFLFHRPRRYNAAENCWMGWERKRGKLEEFNAMLRGEGAGRFVRVVGNAASLASVRYVIVLDADTDLPLATAWRLVGAAAHPLNRAIVDPQTRRLRRGYVIFQPRVSISLRSARRSWYSLLLSGEVGVDPYTRVVSDVYQDLFAEASFIGKGLYDVDGFRAVLAGRFPENTVLSHDLLESCHARCGLISDVELIEDHPSRYLADADRHHRWMRGDWQIAPWLGWRVRDAAGKAVPGTLGALGRWKILDNLRRALVPGGLVVLLSAVWLTAPSAALWTAWAAALLLIPQLLPAIPELLSRPRDVPFSQHLASIRRGLVGRAGRFLLAITLLPHEAAVALDATVRTLWRMLVSRRSLLEWQTAATTDRDAADQFRGILRRMWIGPALAVGLGAALLVRGGLFVTGALPLLILWFASPAVAWWISRPLASRMRPLEADDIRMVRRVARMTWRFFEDLVGPQENWLAPDNLQEVPQHRVAHRTSPTNLGLALLANLTAHDLGYVSTRQFLSRTSLSLESMEQLERYRGHLYNWYDTRTRKAIRPFYVSTVDSGNLIGHLAVLRMGLLDLASQPLWPAARAAGLADTLAVLEHHIQSGQRGGNRLDTVAAASMQSARWLLSQYPTGLRATAAWLGDARIAAIQIAGAINPAAFPEASWWAHALVRQTEAMIEDVGEIAPWLSAAREGLGPDARALVDRLDAAESLKSIVQTAQEAARLLDRSLLQPAERPTLEAIQTGARNIESRIHQAQTLVRQCAELGEADFSFLYDKSRKLLAIGYSVSDRRLDNSYYDLLASEARIVSFALIASGKLPVEHWFALGRSLTMVRGTPALLSWSGSMFEYLMPLLVMPAYDQTLIDESCRAVVARQAEYGRQRGVPWGISESGYCLTDSDGNYQYRAFGVPGLGLRRGLSDDLVVAPYATSLALLVDPQRSCQNLRVLADHGFLGAYGYYEAIDYTPSRMVDGRTHTVVRSYMAHHQGMSLLAMAQAAIGPVMHRRFLGNPEFRSADLLLQERIPRLSSPLHPHEREARTTRRLAEGGPEPAMRVFTNPNTPVPEVHLLSNGRYHVAVSAAGGGYSRWNDLALTRWREDATADSYGVFCYVAEPEGGRFWSTAYQPTLRFGRHYEAIFTQGRAEFRRQDEGIETHTEIAVSPEDDLEIRRITLTNRSDALRSLHVSTYAEAVLAPQIADELHPVFSNLFVQTEILGERHAMLLTRRPRSAEEKPAWMFCILQPAEGAAGKCSFETDRARFVGRCRSLRQPAAMENNGPLSGSAGAVLDPCLAARCPVELGTDASARIDLIIGAAPTRDAAMALVLKYQDRRMVDRVFELGATHSRVTLGHLGCSEAQAQWFGHLASSVIYPSAACRAPASLIRRNRKGPSGLWGYGISGDNPIILLRIADTENLRLVRELLMAHAYWRMKGLTSDLVIWNEDVSGYRQTLNDQIMGLIASGTEAHLVDKPGGVFVRHIEQIAEEDRVLMLASARLAVSDADGPLDTQLERRATVVATPPASLLPTPRLTPVRPQSPPAPPRTDLKFFNGIGGFTQDGREYIVTVSADQPTPAPWVNVIANARLGCVVSQGGCGFTWFENSQLFRLTPWENDPVREVGGEMLLVRDDQTGRFFGAMPQSVAGRGSYVCRHGFGYTIFEHGQEGLESELTTYVAVDAPVRFLSLRLSNTSGGRRSVSVLAAFDLVLGDLRSRNAMHIVTELDPRSGAIFARNSRSAELGGVTAFLDCSETIRTVTGDRAEVLGRNGARASPAAMRLRRLSGRLGAAMDPCAAMMTRVDLAEGEQRQIVFVFGAGRDAEEAASVLKRYRGVAASRVALQEVWQTWNDRLGVLYAETPDESLNVLTNGWLPYQALSCRIWGRSAFYQSGGAWGYRDQLQDCLALLHEMPKLAREHLLRCAGRMFAEGDVQHWWHPPTGRGVRTTCSDDYLWLPYAVCRYVTFTGDTGVLSERVPFLAGRPLRAGEESYYDLPNASERSDTLYEHCVRAVAHGLRFGSHGLPLIGGGDWNDGMNRVGAEGRGESVWLAFFLHSVLVDFAALASRRGDAAFATRCLAESRQLAENVERHAWDGHWYRRAFFDNGEPLGSAQNVECQIDLLPQSWAVISGVGDRHRRQEALNAAWERLVRKDLDIVQLLTPPFDTSAVDPGYIKGYLPGVRENGGQYTHAAVWAAMAYAMAGRVEQAYAIVAMLNPINHAADPAGVDRYKVEPYAVAADVYSSPQHGGRGGWTWYTGSAGWFYRLIHEVLLGLDRRVDEVRFHPCVPRDWREYKLHYRYYQTFYHITFHQDPSHTGPPTILVDREPQPGGVLKLVNDSAEHSVEVRFAPCAPSAGE